MLVFNLPRIILFDEDVRIGMCRQGKPRMF